MAAHADVLDRPEPLTIPFWGSIVMHVVMIGVLSLGAVVERQHRLNMGSPTGGGLGSVTVTPVASIPIPSNGGPKNPVANDTQSQLPTPPAPPKKAAPVRKVQTAPEKAIPLYTDRAPKKQTPQPQSQSNTYRDTQKYPDNQLYSTSGQRLSSQDYAMQGGGGVRLGDNSPFGEQFGSYANLIRENIARHWQPSSLNVRSATPFVVITFTIRRDGSIVNATISQPSGNFALDNSALRAVMDTTLSALPPGFPRAQADVAMRFELGK